MSGLAPPGEAWLEFVRFVERVIYDPSLAPFLKLAALMVIVAILGWLVHRRT